MIPLSLFTVLLCILFGLIVYTFIDNRNRMYGNVITSLLAAFFSFAAGMQCFAGEVQLVFSEVVNTSTGAYADHYIVVYLPVLGYMLTGIGIVMSVLTVLLVIEVLSEIFGGE